MKRDVSHHLYFRYEQSVFYLSTPLTAKNVADPNLRASGSPGGSVVKNPPASSGDGFNPLARQIPGEGNGNPLQYSGLGNLMDRGAWQATIHGVTKEWNNPDPGLLSSSSLHLPLNNDSSRIPVYFSKQEGRGWEELYKYQLYSYTNICFSSSTLRIMLSTL